MKRIVTAIICGACRDKASVYLIIARCLDLRDEGLIDDIILSTWYGEVEQLGDLRKRLARTGVRLVESDLSQYDEDEINKLYQMSAIRQKEQLRAALWYVPEGSFVLKLRTDAALSWLNQIVPLLKNPNVDFAVGKYNHFPSLFDNRISCF